MVLEAIVNPRDARGNPWKIAVLAFAFVTIGLWSADFLGVYKSIIAITLIAVPAAPFLWRLFDYEEDEVEISTVLGTRTIMRHLPVIIVLVSFFVGLIAAFTFWYLALPTEKAASLFEVQNNELNNIRGGVTGLAVNTNPEQVNQVLEIFEKIFLHNLGVLSIILLFSLLYGAGAVLVFVWNASIIAAFIGNYARASGASVSLVTGIASGALGLLPHGSFELLAYLIAALAGGIVSSAVVHQAHKSSTMLLVLHDGAKLTAVSIILLAIGAIIESGAIVG